ncbi:hypothetical protein K438DRAFT_1759465 [Mycena galopus ATCC 62051]|nr:hypothetical protein K438DRAFT_1759465 [Mycena galopus ATCC 62051]
MPASTVQRCGDDEEHHLQRLVTYRKYRRSVGIGNVFEKASLIVQGEPPSRKMQKKEKTIGLAPLSLDLVLMRLLCPPKRLPFVRSQSPVLPAAQLCADAGTSACRGSWGQARQSMEWVLPSQDPSCHPNASAIASSPIPGQIPNIWVGEERAEAGAGGTRWSRQHEVVLKAMHFGFACQEKVPLDEAALHKSDNWNEPS